jgi:hypothetical protein
MKQRRPEAIKDEDLLNACRRRVERGTAFVDTGLAQERREVQEYWLGNLPLPLTAGGSKFRSQDVYVAVESMKAQIVESFSAGSNIVQFSPQTAMDVVLAKQATAMCEFAIHRQNDALSLFMDVAHDGLTNRIGIAEVEWERSETAVEYEYGPATMEELTETLSQPDVRPIGKTKVSKAADGVTTLYSGRFERITDTSQVKMTAVPPEELIVFGRCSSLDDAKLVSRRMRMTMGELAAQFPEKQDEIFNATGLETDTIYDEETLAREAMSNASIGVASGGVGAGVSRVNNKIPLAISGSTWLDDDDAEDAAGQMLTVYKTYIRIDAEGRGRQDLYRVIHCGEVMIDKVKVDDHPWVIFKPAPMPHVFWGDNFAARVIQTANVKTTLTRAIIEQAVDATNPRYMVARGGLAQARELLDNRRGGIVNVRSLADSVAPLPQTPINPFVLQTIGLVDSDRQDITGISRLSQGLDKNALSHRNSGGLVEQLTDNSMVRTKIIARLFAAQFLKNLYLKVYALIIKHEKTERIIEVAGNYVPVTPSDWKSRKDCIVDMSLGYNEREAKVKDMAEFVAMMDANPANQRLFDEKKRYNVYKTMLETKGYKNVQDFLNDPEQLQPPEPDPMAMLALEEQKKKVEIMEREQAIREQQIIHNLQMAEQEFELKAQDTAFKAQMSIREADRKDADAASVIDTRQAETMVLVENAANPQGKLQQNTIISPS